MEIMKGLTSIDGLALFNLEGVGMMGVPGIATRLVHDALCTGTQGTEILTCYWGLLSVCVLSVRRSPQVPSQRDFHRTGLGPYDNITLPRIGNSI